MIQKSADSAQDYSGILVMILVAHSAALMNNLHTICMNQIVFAKKRDDKSSFAISLSANLSNIYHASNSFGIN